MNFDEGWRVFNTEKKVRKIGFKPIKSSAVDSKPQR